MFYESKDPISALIAGLFSRGNFPSSSVGQFVDFDYEGKGREQEVLIFEILRVGIKRRVKFSRALQPETEESAVEQITGQGGQIRVGVSLPSDSTHPGTYLTSSALITHLAIILRGASVFDWGLWSSSPSNLSYTTFPLGGGVRVESKLAQQSVGHWMDCPKSLETSEILDPGLFSPEFLVAPGVSACPYQRTSTSRNILSQFASEMFSDLLFPLLQIGFGHLSFSSQ